MSVIYRFQDDVVEMVLEGENPPDAVIQCFNKAVEDPEVPEQFFLIVDVRKSTSLATRPTQDIIRVAEYIGPFQDRVMRCAVLATENVHFGLSRLGAVYSETAGVMTSVFRDRDEAVSWLHRKSDA
jgi:hypothetical protein